MLLPETSSFLLAGGHSSLIVDLGPGNEVGFLSRDEETCESVGDSTLMSGEAVTRAVAGGVSGPIIIILGVTMSAPGGDGVHVGDMWMISDEEEGIREE